MTRKIISTDSIRKKRPPKGISEQDWINTPDSVQKFISLLMNPKKPRNNFPLWFVLLLNVVFIGGLGYFLTNKIVFPCIAPPYVSSLSTALVLVAFVHFSWRYVHTAIPLRRSGATTFTFEVAGFKFEFDRNIFIAFLNEMQPWKISSRLLGISLFIFFIAGLVLNLSSYSPFYQGGQPFLIQSFAVQRSSSSSPEQLAPGETLTMTAGEKVILDVVFLGSTQVSCTWSISSKGSNVVTGCSVDYTALTPGEDDILTVFVQPACGSRKEAASLFIAIQP